MLSAADGLPYETEYDISKKKWDALVGALFNGLRLNDRERTFDDHGVLDGEEWELTVKLKNGAKRSYSGINGYPPCRKKLFKLMRPLFKSPKAGTARKVPR